MEKKPSPKKKAPKKVAKKSTKKPKPVEDKEPTIMVIDAEELSKMAELTKQEQSQNVLNFLSKLGISNLAKETLDPYSEYLVAETRQDYERLRILLSEYLDSYIMVGFRADGRTMAIRAQSGDRDKNALDNIMQGLVMGRLKFNES